MLGAIFINNDAYIQISDGLEPGDFYLRSHGDIYAAMEALCLRQDPVDPITLAQELEKRGVELDLELIASLGADTPTSANIGHYAKIVKDAANRRRLFTDLREVAVAARDGDGEVEDLVDKALTTVMGMSADVTQGKAVTLDQIIHETIDHLDKIYRGDAEADIAPTGFYDLDAKIQGLEKGRLIILAARPAMGKTAFALRLARNVAEQGRRALMFSLEMSRAQLGLRLISEIAEIPTSVLRAKQLMEVHFSRMIEAAATLYELPLVIDDSTNVGISDIRAIARRMKAQGCLDVIFIDYLQLMRTRSSADTREREIAEISRGLKLLSKELDVAIVCLAQLNRKCEERTDKRPVPSDLRESGSLEQDADMVLFIYRDEVYNNDTEEPGVAEIIVGKNRDGEIGKVKLGFEASLTRFYNRSQREDAA